MSFDAILPAFKHRCSLAVFDDEKLVALNLNRLHTPNEFSSIFGDCNTNSEIKDDYAEDIHNGPYNLNSNRINVFLQECLKQTGQFFPEDIKNIGYLKAIAIHPNYQRSGISQVLMTETFKRYQKFDCNYTLAYALVNQSYKIAIRVSL